MSKLFFFLLGIIIGGTAVFVILCCMQINRINEYEMEIQKLKQQNQKNQKTLV